MHKSFSRLRALLPIVVLSTTLTLPAHAVKQFEKQNANQVAGKRSSEERTSATNGGATASVQMIQGTVKSISRENVLLGLPATPGSAKGTERLVDISQASFQSPDGQPGDMQKIDLGQSIIVVGMMEQSVFTAHIIEVAQTATSEPASQIANDFSKPESADSNKTIRLVSDKQLHNADSLKPD